MHRDGSQDRRGPETREAELWRKASPEAQDWGPEATPPPGCAIPGRSPNFLERLSFLL